MDACRSWAGHSLRRAVFELTLLTSLKLELADISDTEPGFCFYYPWKHLRYQIT